METKIPLSTLYEPNSLNPSILLKAFLFDVVCVRNFEVTEKDREFFVKLDIIRRKNCSIFRDWISSSIAHLIISQQQTHVDTLFELFFENPDYRQWNEDETLDFIEKFLKSAKAEVRSLLKSEKMEIISADKYCEPSTYMEFQPDFLIKVIPWFVDIILAMVQESFIIPSSMVWKELELVQVENSTNATIIGSECGIPHFYAVTGTTNSGKSSFIQHAYGFNTDPSIISNTRKFQCFPSNEKTGNNKIYIVDCPAFDAHLPHGIGGLTRFCLPLFSGIIIVHRMSSFLTLGSAQFQEGLNEVKIPCIVFLNQADYFLKSMEQDCFENDTRWQLLKTLNPRWNPKAEFESVMLKKLDDAGKLHNAIGGAITCFCVRSEVLKYLQKQELLAETEFSKYDMNAPFNMEMITSHILGPRGCKKLVAQIFPELDQ